MNSWKQAAGRLVFLFALSSSTTVFAAVQMGQKDTFETGNLQSWQAGGSRNPNGPTNVATGGPAGIDDNYLLLRSSGVSGAGGKLVGFNRSQWAGNFSQAKVNGLSMDVNNLGTTDLTLRLVLENTSARQSLGTIAPVTVKAGSGWTSVYFSLDPSNLRGGNVNTVLGNVGELNLVHSTNVVTDRAQSQRIAARLGIDNIVAVPEPVVTTATTLGLLGVLAAARRRRKALHPA